MRFHDTHALLLPREGVYLQWEVEPENTDMTTVEVEILRSESPSGPWTKLQVIDPLVSFVFTDRTAPWRPKNAEVYYSLRAVLKSNATEINISDPFGFQGLLTIDAAEIIRQHNILLYGVNGHRPQTGIPTAVFKKRTFGPRCSACTDSGTRQIVLSNCRECIGTGYDGGYFDRLIVNMNFQPSPKMTQITNFGKIEDNETVAMTTNFPILVAGDMVVEPNNAHWRIVNVDVTERKRVVVHQMLRLRQADHNDIVNEMLKHQEN